MIEFSCDIEEVEATSGGDSASPAVAGSAQFKYVLANLALLIPNNIKPIDKPVL